LSMNPASVRERAHAAIDALGPQTDVSPESRALIADYLLRQLSGPEEAVRALDLLEDSAAERAWARVVASELSPLGGGPLPEIPTEGSGREAPAPPAAAPAPGPEAAPAPEPEPVEPAIAAAPGPRLAPSDPTAPPGGGEGGPGAGRRGAGGLGGGGRRSSRIGGAILIAAVVIAAIVVAVVLLSSGGNTPNHQTAADRSTTTSSTPAASASASSSASTTTTSASSSTAAKVVAQINLTPPAKGSKAAGIAEVLDEGSSQGIAIVADNVPPNKSAPHPNAYAVWLYNSSSDAKILGFVNPGVGSNGKLQTAGALPSGASRYKQLIVTVETQAKPAKPGTIILRGPLTGLS
ncbi:MAG TPA: hypothetical protein VFN87_10370, partial [Solirubrobacteraceae bacterium]|nr:hypothetical protein [Solirubrobacteraceae bacterium]